MAAQSRYICCNLILNSSTPIDSFQSQSLYGSVDVGSAGMFPSAAYKVFPWTALSWASSTCPLLPLPSPLSATPPPCSPRQDSIGGGGVSIGVASFPPGSHWPAGLLTRLWLAVPIPTSLSHWLWSLSAIFGLDTSISLLSKLFVSYYIWWPCSLRPRTFLVFCDVIRYHPLLIHCSTLTASDCRQLFTRYWLPHPHCSALCSSDLGRPDARRRCKFRPPVTSCWPSGNPSRSRAGDAATSHTVPLTDHCRASCFALVYLEK